MKPLPFLRQFGMIATDVTIGTGGLQHRNTTVTPPVGTADGITSDIERNILTQLLMGNNLIEQVSGFALIRCEMVGFSGSLQQILPKTARTVNKRRIRVVLNFSLCAAKTISGGIITLRGMTQQRTGAVILEC